MRRGGCGRVSAASARRSTGCAGPARSGRAAMPAGASHAARSAAAWRSPLGRPSPPPTRSVAARRSAEKTVLRFLFWDAWRNGAWALAGRVEPWLVDALGGANWAILRWLHQWTLLHSPRPEILHAIERGDALLSHLDGEWWL